MPIVTDGLIGYWHYKDFSTSMWNNIAPNTIGKYNWIVAGATLNSDGIYFDGVDDRVVVGGFEQTDSYSLEFWLKAEQGSTRSSFFEGMEGVNDTRNRILFTDFGLIDQAIGLDGALGTTTATLGLRDSYNIQSYELTHLSITYESKVTNNRRTYDVSLYVNGRLMHVKNYFSNSYSMDLGLGNILILGTSRLNNFFYRGLIQSVKIYNKVLAGTEVEQNYAVIDEIGLEEPEEPNPTPPLVSIVRKTRNKISANRDVDRSNLSFKFDQDVTEWVVRVMGASWDTGILADSGGMVSAGQEITAEIDSTELYQEGQNKINIYGKNSSGLWTPYVAD